MEIKTFSSALVLSLLMVGPAVMAMEEDQDKGGAPVVQQTLQPAPETPVTEEGKATGVSAPVVIKEDPEAKTMYNLWGLLGSSTPEPEKTVGAAKSAQGKRTCEKTTIILPSETPTKDEQNGGGWFSWLGGSAVKTPVSTPAPESTSEPASTPIAVAPEPEKDEAPTPTAAPVPLDKSKADVSQPEDTLASQKVAVSTQEKEALSWLEWFFGKKEKFSTPPALTTVEAQVPAEEKNPSQISQGQVAPDLIPAVEGQKISPALTESIMGLSEELLGLIQDPIAREKAQALQARLRAVKDAGNSSQN